MSIKYRWTIALIQFIYIVFCVNESNGDGLYSIVAPGKLIAKADYLITIATYGTENQTSIFAIIEAENNATKIESRFSIEPNETKIVKLNVGELKADTKYALTITGTGGVSFTHSSPLHLESKSVSLFIQTDKAMYKAGQKVMFRVVVTDQDLKPIENKDVNIQIKDANSNVIKKFSLKSTSNGIVSSELQLSDQPVLGDWTLSVNVDGKKEQKRFTIAEYVLPSFSVDVVIPSFITKKTTTLSGVVKAMYTYGKPVKGELILTVTDQLSSYFNGSYSKRKRYELKTAIDGEHQFEVSQAMLTGGEGVYYQHIVDFEASVKDILTGKVYNSTSSLRILEKKYKFELLKNRKYKINTTYVNFVKITHQDDTPIANSDKKLVLKYGFGWDSRNRKFTYETVPVNGIAKIEMFIEDTNDTVSVIRPYYEEPRPYLPFDNDAVLEPLELEVSVPDNNDTKIVPTPVPVNRTSNVRSLINVLKNNTNDTKLNFGPTWRRMPLIRPPPILRPVDKSSISIEAVYDDQESFLATIYQNDDKNDCSVDLQIVNEVYNKVYKENDEIKFEVSSDSEPLNEFIYQIVTRKGVVLADKVKAEGLKPETFTVKVTKEFYPKANLVVHFFCKRRVVEKTLTILVENIFDNKPIVSMNSSETKPSSTVNIKIQAKPHSSVAILGYDQRMALLKSGFDIEKSSVTEAMENQLGCNGGNQFSSCVQNDYWYRSQRRLNFDDSGLIHFSNVPIPFDVNPYPRHFILYSAGVSQRGPMGGPFEDRYEELEFDSEAIDPMVLKTSEVGNPMKSKAVTIRQNFPETWIFDVIDTDESGVTSINRQIPDSITSWFITSFAINKNDGFGLTDNKSTIKVFRPFFIRLSLPYSVIRGETVAVELTVYNYFNRPETAEVKMESNDDYDFVIAENEENEVSFSKQTKTKTIIVPANDGISLSFLIKPKKIGYINIKVIAISSSEADGVSERLLVKPEGNRHYLNHAILLNLKNGETVTEQIDVEIPDKYVPDSERVTVTAIGDVMGPAINNLDDLLRMPYGCGEQNMINFVPNIVVLDYLTKAGKLNENIKSKAIKHIESGYQRELTYEHDDGSYSAFGKSDAHGSTWLTAFVLKSFIQAKNHINIDEKVTKRSLKFLLKKQNENGSFKEDGRLLDFKMKGAVGGESAALTAYVYIALLHTDLNPQELKKTETYLLNHLNSTENVYEIAIITYALHLSNSSEKEFAFTKLMQASQSKSGLVYWSDKSEAASIEMTAYSLMTLMIRDDLVTALPVLRYLVSKQNSNGGYSSTQDTVIGIQALSTFANKVSNKSPEIKIRVETEKLNGEENNLLINPENSIVLQEMSLSPNTRKVSLSATGQGSAIMQLSWQYNVLNETSEPAFEIRYQIEDGTADSLLVINIFTKYLKGKASGMAVMEITLPSGYIADVESLHDLKKSDVKRVETKDEDTVVVIYFDEISDQEITVKVVAERKVKVANLKPVPITVYDYYDKSKTATILYSPGSTSICDICDKEDCGKSCS